MTPKDILMLVNTLKGAGLSCLFVIQAIREPMTIKELAAYTGYDRKSVSVALDKLAVMGLSHRTPGDRWQCSGDTNLSVGRFLNIGTENFQDSSKTESLKASLKPTYLTDGNVGRNSEHENYTTELTALINKLTARRCARQKAEAAIETALHHKPLAAIEADIDGWLAYCDSEAGKSIKVKGLFTASKIKNGETPPPPESEPDNNGNFTEHERGLFLR